MKPTDEQMLRAALYKSREIIGQLRAVLEVIAAGEEVEAAVVAKQALRNLAE